MSTNNSLTIEQVGFRTGHSTELAVIQLVNHLSKQMDMGKVLSKIYIDLSKAFDTLDHFILLDKLTYYGVCLLENLLLRDYLSGRHQYVDYNGPTSRTKLYFTRCTAGLYSRASVLLYILMTYLRSAISSSC